MPCKRLAVQPNGKLLAAGTFTNIQGQSVLSAWPAFNPDLSMDDSFDTSAGAGRANPLLGFFNLTEKILIGGAFTNFGNISALRGCAPIGKTAPWTSAFQTAPSSAKCFALANRRRWRHLSGAEAVPLEAAQKPIYHLDQNGIQDTPLYPGRRPLLPPCAFGWLATDPFTQEGNGGIQASYFKRIIGCWI